MKIAVWHNLPSGGGKRALYYHVQGLIERGHSVEVWCPPSADQSYLPLRDLVVEHVVPLNWRPGKKNNPVSKLVAARRGQINMLKALDHHVQACAERINSSDFDILLANTCMYSFAPPIGRYIKIPHALYLQEPNRTLYEAMPHLPWAAPVPARNLADVPRYVKTSLMDAIKFHSLRTMVLEEWLNAHSYDRVLVNSLFSRESLLRAYGLNAHVCYLGVDTHKFVYRNLPREPILVGVGAFGPHKNITLVVEAIGRMQGIRPRLVWIGNDAARSYLESVKRLATSLGVTFEPKVRVEDDELVELLNRATAMVYSPRLEPFGFAPLEANACGTAVIAVAEGGVRETIVDGVNGLLVEHDPGAMAEAIQRLLQDSTLARELGENGRRLVVDRWSLAASIDRLERSLIDLLGWPVGAARQARQDSVEV